MMPYIYRPRSSWKSFLCFFVPDSTNSNCQTIPDAVRALPFYSRVLKLNWFSLYYDQISFRHRYTGPHLNFPYLGMELLFATGRMLQSGVAVVLAFHLYLKFFSSAWVSSVSKGTAPVRRPPIRKPRFVRNCCMDPGRILWEATYPTYVQTLFSSAWLSWFVVRLRPSSVNTGFSKTGCMGPDQIFWEVSYPPYFQTFFTFLFLLLFDIFIFFSEVLRFFFFRFR